jgi:hypothetical protein
MIEQSSPTVLPADREVLRNVLRSVNSRSDLAHGNVRVFRNILIWLTVVLTLFLILTAIVAWNDPTLFSVCGPTVTVAGSSAAPTATPTACPHGSVPVSGDVLMVELLGALGGLLSAVFFLKGLQAVRGPYGLPLAQGILKVPTGAAVALVGVWVLQRGVLGLLTPQSGDKIIAYAVLFGFAQQALTNALDTRASALIGTAISTTPSARPASTTQAAPAGGTKETKP